MPPANMLLRSHPFSVESSRTADDVRVVLGARGREWRESTLSGTARSAAILGWRVRERNGQVIVQPRTIGAAGLPMFCGRIQSTASGSAIIGELRLSWFGRGFRLCWLTGIASSAAFWMLGQIPDATPAGRLRFAAQVLLPLGLGWWAMRDASTRARDAIQEVLMDVARADRSGGQ